ncbi:hypothetical protein [uncultured Clostridium sp.]|uniref:hypothetical protein n=1 Tax=uncultured Clostridium sp. TaxID=59620 RepID=UPI0025CD218B|nr:hypothetical protein [uncultured Clostridium sp.]
MYCVIQEIELKKENPYGHEKILEAYKFEISFNGLDQSYYAYRYTGGRFERHIKKAYKISLHQSYRDNGKVKKKQYSVCTMSYYDLIDFGLYDCASNRIEMLSDTLKISEDDLYKLIYEKLDPLVEKVTKEFQQTEEYKIREEQRQILNRYQEEKRKFEEEYGSDSYKYYYDVFCVLREPKKFEAFKRSYEAKKENERRYYENYNSNYSNYNNSSYSTSQESNYTDKEKEYLKKIYRAAAVKLHPDIIKDDGSGMKFLNKLKDEWGV